MSQRLALQFFTSKLDTAGGARASRVPPAVLVLYGPRGHHELLRRGSGSQNWIGQAPAHHRHGTRLGDSERDQSGRFQIGATVPGLPWRLASPLRIVHGEWRQAGPAWDEDRRRRERTSAAKQ